MTRTGLTIRLLALAGFATGGWFAASYWQATPQIRSVVQLLFRQAAGGHSPTENGVATLQGIPFSLTDIRDADSLRQMLDRLRDAAAGASPQEVEAFVLALLDQASRLSPGDIRALAVEIARDPDLRQKMDFTGRVFSLRMLSQDQQSNLFMAVASITQRDPDRMLLLADALPKSRLRDEVMSRVLTALSLDRPGEVIALLTGPEPPLDGQARGGVFQTALSALAAQDFGAAVTAWKAIPDPWSQRAAAGTLVAQIRTHPAEVLAWMDTLPEKERAGAAEVAMSGADSAVAAQWLIKHSGSPENVAGALAACATLSSTDPAAAAAWLAKVPLEQTPDELRDQTARRVALSTQGVPASVLASALSGMPPERQAILLRGAFSSGGHPASDLVTATAGIQDPDLLAQLGQDWGNWGAPLAQRAPDAETLPPGPLRTSALSTVSAEWSKENPDAWFTWMQTLPAADQSAALARTDPAAWSDPARAAFLTTRPPAEQLPYLASVYHDNAAAAAAVIEQASTQGASDASLDSAAQTLADSWRDRDPETARAFALSLPDPALADSVLVGLAARSATAAARAAALPLIQDPILRQQAERAAALKDAGLKLPPSTP